MAEVDPSQSQEAPQTETQTYPSSSQQTQEASQPWFDGLDSTEAGTEEAEERREQERAESLRTWFTKVPGEELDWSAQGHEDNSVSWYDQPVWDDAGNQVWLGEPVAQSE